jgi:transcriptional regulator with XRE-family HTH domain
MTFAEALTDEIGRSRLTRETIATRSQIDKTTLYRLTSGRTPSPTLDVFCRLVGVLPGLIQYIYKNGTVAPRNTTAPKEPRHDRST